MSLNAKEPPKVAITRRSRVHGVVITQVVQQVPVGKSTPDFIRKPMAMTINEGRRAFFKATVSGEPTPSVTWGRNKGDVNDADKYKIKYEEKSKEHILEIPQAKPELADTYKCFATNEYGTAVCSATLIVIKAKDDEPQDFRKMLKKTVVVTKKKQLPPKEGELDPKLLEVLLTAPKKDYQRICLDFGVTDFRWLLKRLNQLKKERADEQAKVVENIGNVRQIEVKPSGKAEFSLDMTLLDPNSKIYLYKDGNRVPYGNNGNSKHSLQKRGNTYCFTIKDPQPEDAGLYQVDVGETTVLTTDFQVPAVSFADKINNTKALENKDASFQCVLSTPLNRITWSTSDSSLEHGDKYEINVSEDKLTHTLTIKNCEKADNGTYYAIAGTASCKASLVVEADPNAHKGLKKSKDQHELAKLEIEDTKEKDRQNESSGKIGAGVGDDSSGKSDITKDDWSHDSHGWKGKSENNNNLLGARDESQKVDAGKERVQAGLTVSDAAQDQGVQFVSGLSDATAVTGGRAELFCKLSTENAKGRWYKNGKLLTDDDGVQIIQDGAHHKLIIDCCNKEDGAVYRFESDGRKSEATLNIQDPPKVDASALVKFTKPVVVKAGETAEWKLQFSGGEPMKIQWSKDDDELLPALNMRIEKSATSSKLRLAKCQRKDSGEIKIKIKNEFGTTEAISKLIVLDKPTPPQGPVEILESALTSVEFKWKPPKDDGGCPITDYIIERQQVGRNKWSSLGQIGGNSTVYRDSDVEPGKRYCYRIRAKNSEGVSDCLQTEAIAAGVLRYPGAPSPPKVVRACKDCISLAWSAPCNTGGTKIVGFNLEKRKKGTNNWSLVNQEGPIKDSKYEVKDVCEGVAYEFRVSAINLSGPGDPSNPSDAVIARDPMKPPGKVTDLRVTSSDYVTLSLAWTKPKEVKGSQDEAQGYYVEIRPVASSDWTRCNGVPITTTTYTVRGLKAMAAYWVRVVATNYGGDGEPRGFDNHIIAMPPPVWPKFKDRNLKNFVVVRAGNTVRLNIPFEASPFPEVSWLKDGALVPKHVTVTNSDKASQMLIPTSERSDSGVYTVIVKNLVGQESFNVEIRVTDDPKPPGPVELYQNVPGTVTVSWAPSPDETKDDRLHYVISKRDSFKPTWRTVAENLFNNKFTVVDIVPGRQYHFRVYAKNDMGLSAPSVSPAFEIKKERERFKVNVPPRKSVDLSSAPSFITPLRRHIPPEGYECHMSCAVKGDPAPRVAWYHDDVDLSVNSNYYITNVCGVCSLLILRVGANDGGEYKVVVENHLGSAESSMMLKVREKRTWTMEATTEYL